MHAPAYSFNQPHSPIHANSHSLLNHLPVLSLINHLPAISQPLINHLPLINHPSAISKPPITSTSYYTTICLLSIIHQLAIPRLITQPQILLSTFVSYFISTIYQLLTIHMHVVDQPLIYSSRAVTIRVFTSQQPSTSHSLNKAASLRKHSLTA